MIVINLYQENDKHHIELKTNYLKREVYKIFFNAVMKMGFKHNKVRNTYHKFVTNNYPQDALIELIDDLKKLDTHYEIRSYKLINNERNF